MSRVAKYRRQVSEDPDIDNLLSTLSPEEMEQLQKELDAGDPEAGVSAGLRRDQTERASSQRESNRLAQTQQSSESAKSSAKAKEENKERKNAKEREERANEREEKAKDVCTPSPSPAKKLEEERAKDVCTPSPSPAKKLQDTKDIEAQGKKQTEIRKDERVSKMRERFRQEKNSSAVAKDKLDRTSSKQLDKEKSIKQTEIEKAEKVNIEEKTEKKVAKVQPEKKLDKKIISDKPSEKINKSDSIQFNKNISKVQKDKSENIQVSQTIPQEQLPTEQDKKSIKITGTQKVENGAKNTAEDNKEDESNSIFDELIEKVKNNEAGMTELNLNNSDCITIETLMSFAEALEFNTVVKTFSLTNTRADDHIALAIAAMLKSNKTIVSINLDSNHITGKGILAIFRALQHNDTLTELRFHNQRHICGGKTEMEIAKMLKENTTLLKLGYHFELAGPRMTVTNLLSRNMDKQRQRRIAEQKALKEAENKKNCLEVPKVIPPLNDQPKSLSKPAINSSQKGISKKGGIPIPPPPPPPLAPLAPPLINENIRNSLSPASQRRIVEKTGPAEKNTRDQLLESIRSSNMKQLKKVEVPKWLK